MDASDLRIFEAVARFGGMNRAAAELNTVQSNVTARIRALEEQLGVSLFRRTSRGAVLSAAGERLLPYAIRVAQLLAEAQRAARRNPVRPPPGRARFERASSALTAFLDHVRPKSTPLLAAE